MCCLKTKHPLQGALSSAIDSIVPVLGVLQIVDLLAQDCLHLLVQNLADFLGVEVRRHLNFTRTGQSLSGTDIFVPSALSVDFATVGPFPCDTVVLFGTAMRDRDDQVNLTLFVLI